MIIIYDFDGTLTPYSLPQYPILRKYGYDDQKLLTRVKGEVANGMELYEAFFKCYIDILTENGEPVSRDNVCLGARDVEYNKGVLEYFKRFQSDRTGIKHYVVTSGIAEYARESAVGDFVDGVYGTTFSENNGTYEKANFVLSDKKKVDIIKRIVDSSADNERVVYFGDGLTDKFAFEYVHSIGGINVFVAVNEEAKNNYHKLNEFGIIDRCFDADFSNGSQIGEFVQNLNVSVDNQNRSL